MPEPDKIMAQFKDGFGFLEMLTKRKDLPEAVVFDFALLLGKTLVCDKMIESNELIGEGQDCEDTVRTSLPSDILEYAHEALAS